LIVLHNHIVYEEPEDKRNRGKMKESVSRKAGNISIIQKRLEILWSTRFTDRSEVEEAVKIQERLSKKSPEDWSGTEEIRRFREREAVGKSSYRF
jgi:hypothetical protein